MSVVVGWSGLILVPALAKVRRVMAGKEKPPHKQDQADDEPRRDRQLPEDAEREESVENDAEGDDGEQEDRREDDDVGMVFLLVQRGRGHNLSLPYPFKGPKAACGGNAAQLVFAKV